jgi:hypothetical protein
MGGVKAPKAAEIYYKDNKRQRQRENSVNSPQNFGQIAGNKVFQF